eukprot:3074174-Rhodomonas_salina.1
MCQYRASRSKRVGGWARRRGYYGAGCSGNLPILLRGCYAMSSTGRPVLRKARTDTGSGTVLGICYAVSGTDIGYGAARLRR